MKMQPLFVCWLLTFGAGLLLNAADEGAPKRSPDAKEKVEPAEVIPPAICFTGRQFVFEDYLKGVQAAIKDISENRIAIHRIGQGRVTDKDLQLKAKSEYGVELKLMGCIVPPNEDFYEGYSNTTIAYLKKSYGFDPIAALERKLLDQLQPEKPQK